jgi:hypothetical protein
MSDQPRVLSLSQKVTFTAPYLVLLHNKEKIIIHADTVSSIGDEENNLIQYIFYKKNRPVVILEASDVKAIMSQDSVDVEQACLAVTKRKQTTRRVNK